MGESVMLRTCEAVNALSLEVRDLLAEYLDTVWISVQLSDMVSDGESDMGSDRLSLWRADMV